MRRFKDVNEAIRTLSSFQGWVGTPLIVLDKDVVDGTTRLEAWKRLGFPTDPPTVVCRTRTEAVRLLVLAGEAPRAERLLGGKLDHEPTACVIFQLTRAEARKIVNRKLPYQCSTRKSAREHLTRVIQLYYRALEDGHTSVPTDELGAILSTAPATFTSRGYSS